MCGRLRIPRADDLLIKTTDIHQRGEKISAPHATWPKHTYSRRYIPHFFLLIIPPLAHTAKDKKLLECYMLVGGFVSFILAASTCLEN
jgi:hypothetical protein